MQEDLAIRRKRLLYRSWHRGTKELDLVIGGFAKRHLDAMSEDEIELFEAIIEENEVDLYNWLTGKAAVPTRLDNAVMRRLLSFRLTDPDS